MEGKRSEGMGPGHLINESAYWILDYELPTRYEYGNTFEIRRKK